LQLSEKKREKDGCLGRALVKSEIRNSKNKSQIQTSNAQNRQSSNKRWTLRLWFFFILNLQLFEFVSDFEFRISDFVPVVRLCFLIASSDGLD